MDQLFLDRLEEALGAQSVLRAEPLSRHTTFRIGGPAEVLVRPRNIDEVARVVRLCFDEGVPLRVLGCGSDVLVADEGVAGVVMQVADNLAEVHADRSGLVSAQAGATNAEVARIACEAGLSGYEFACGIPGTVGGAAIMNAGAYDGQFSDVAVALACVTRAGEVIEVVADEADWGYRHSRMDGEGMVVVAALLRLIPDDRAVIQARMDELDARRRAKQPLELPSAGSTFKRPAGHFAGKLIQEAGMQGARVGGAQVSTKHAGFVVNVGDATAADVRALMARVQSEVNRVHGVELEPEVRLWGFDDAGAVACADAADHSNDVGLSASADHSSAEGSPSNAS
ncbi:UDP-N-acetylmuramate dehydrogenase [Berryella wangjianweii]|uniref:UDP-N-acetylenolpyruvoylglucosamine reductase n=1 Tax=Berryella wangjianweii TaxID=2734634 RepID=A0A6M8J2B3_9ACTN|nr:UDP-N-acetylmuramate dehydrogenase [Berryella wangjianweii]QKF07727.1 UDP-N-acetylmuramate dehydrogenase [Berryella wangjianweii]